MNPIGQSVSGVVSEPCQPGEAANAPPARGNPAMPSSLPPEQPPMRDSPAASLLVAALVVLHQPCARNKTAARLLLERAAAHDSLTHAEREACRKLADDLDIERTALFPVRAGRCNMKLTGRPPAPSSVSLHKEFV